ncbi:MAG TPA: hypothetical protein VLU96_05340 [Gaiellaceae bacterium]|nr:hypothetical protein [Gaiellaceae bacterium]
MATATAPPKPLIGEELEKMFGLIGDADSVELKLTLPDSAQRSTVRALGIDPLDSELRMVYFFDTTDLRLNAAGVVVRARRVQRKGDDSVVKLRPVVPNELPKEIRSSPNLGVEVDAMPGGYVCSASMKATLGTTDVRKVTLGKRPQRKLFTKEQRAFYEAHAPDGIALDDLTLLGPILVLKLKWKPKDFAQKLVAELWNYPDNSRILELSTKCPPSEAFNVSLEAKAYLTGKGVDLTGEQQTKTKTALDFFSHELSETPS